MKDLSHITVPGKMTVSGAFAMMPQSVMDGLSDKAATDEAARLIGISETTEEEKEEADGGS